MEVLSQDEELILLRLIEELKQYLRLRRPLIEALEMAELLNVPQQLDELKTLVVQILLTQAEHGKRIAHLETLAGEQGMRLAQVEELAKDHSVRLARLEALGEDRSARLARLEALAEDRSARLTRVEQVAEEVREGAHKAKQEAREAKQIASGRDVRLVVEVSWGVGTDERERTHACAAILRRAGVDASGAATGRSATPEAIERARALGVLLALDGTLQNVETLA